LGTDHDTSAGNPLQGDDAERLIVAGGNDQNFVPAQQADQFLAAFRPRKGNLVMQSKRSGHLLHRGELRAGPDNR